MAVIIELFDLVVRVSALPAGVDAFARGVPNSTFCTDGTLGRVSFMNEDDREAFATQLPLGPEALGRVSKHTLDVRGVEWLETGRYAGVDAAWLRGSSPEPLVVPIRWQPHSFAFHTQQELLEHLELIGVENNVEVYRDKRTGEKLYAGRTRPVLDPVQAARLEALRKEGYELVSPFILGGKRDLGFFEKRRVRKGIARMEQLLTFAPDHWSTLWTLGMSLRVLGDHQSAVESFKKAYAINPSNPDVGREYAGQCMIMGDAAEGVRLSRELHKRFPNDVSLHSNLALALLIAGETDEALETARAALEREPSDPITKALTDYVKDVKKGKKGRPTKLPGW